MAHEFIICFAAARIDKKERKFGLIFKVEYKSHVTPKFNEKGLQAE